MQSMLTKQEKKENVNQIPWNKLLNNKKAKRRKWNVLSRMVVTSAVSHFEMSALNALMLLNAVEVVDVDPKQEKENQNCQGTTIPWNEQLNKTTKRRKLNVLFAIIVTLAVIHFEMSALKAYAP